MESYRQGELTLFFTVEALNWRLVWTFGSWVSLLFTTTASASEDLRISAVGLGMAVKVCVSSILCWIFSPTLLGRN